MGILKRVATARRSGELKLTEAVAQAGMERAHIHAIRECLRPEPLKGSVQKLRNTHNPEFYLS